MVNDIKTNKTKKQTKPANKLFQHIQRSIQPRWVQLVALQKYFYLHVVYYNLMIYVHSLNHQYA